MEVSERRKSTTDDKLQNKTISTQNYTEEDSQKLNGDQQKSIEKKNNVDSADKIRTPKEKGKISSPEKSQNIDFRPKSADSKRSLGSKKQLSVEEKRKSAPVRPESIVEWKKPVFNKQSSLEEKNRY